METKTQDRVDQGFEPLEDRRPQQPGFDLFKVMFDVLLHVFCCLFACFGYFSSVFVDRAFEKQQSLASKGWREEEEES